MPNTPVYGWPFPALNDPPNAPGQVQSLALAVESDLARVEDDLASLGELRGYATSDATFNVTSTTATTTGGAVVGTAFVAPPSGTVKVTVTGLVRMTSTSAATTFLSAVIAAGGTVGSGTVIAGSTSDAALRHRKPGTSSSEQSEVMASHVRIPTTALTPGATYNAYLEHWVTAGTGLVGYRRIFVEPW